jgi:hypothetical protein
VYAPGVGPSHSISILGRDECRTAGYDAAFAPGIKPGIGPEGVD